MYIDEGTNKLFKNQNQMFLFSTKQQRLFTEFSLSTVLRIGINYIPCRTNETTILVCQWTIGSSFEKCKQYCFMNCTQHLWDLLRWLHLV